MNLPTQIVVDAALRDGHMIGLDSAGLVIVELQVTPIFKRLIGTQDDERDVATWRVCPAHSRRIAAVAAWNATGNLCGGNA